MNATIEFVTGRCTNHMFCAVASAGDAVRVPVGGRFVCSFCGSKLVDNVARRRRIGLRTGAMIGGSMAAAGLVMFGVGLWLGPPARVPQTFTQVTSAP